MSLYGVKAGLTKRVYPHLLRHACATLMMKNKRVSYLHKGISIKGTSKNAFFPLPLAGEGRVRGRFFGFLARLKIEEVSGSEILEVPYIVQNC